MITVNNKAVIKNLAESQAKGNKNRNRLLLCAIILVTFLLTTVFSVGINYYQTTQNRNASMGRGDFDAELQGPTAKQIKTLKKADKISNVGLYSFSKFINKFEENEITVSLYWGDDSYWNKQKKPAITELKGSYPKQEKEIMLSRKAMQKMNIKNPKIGMNIEVQTYSTTGVEKKESFTLSGYYNDYTNSADGFVSQSYWQANGGDLENVRTSRAFLNFSTPFFFKKDAQRLEKKLQMTEFQIFGYDDQMVTDLVKTIAGLSLIVLVIILCAYLVIYNILYLSIHKDIRYYGLLKTIGTTRKQIRQIIFQQIIKLSIIGIPTGLLAGGGVSLFAVSKIVSQLYYGQKVQQVSLNPLIFIGAALFTLLTIYISIRKPTKIAAQISPIEAIKYTGISSNKNPKQSERGGKVAGMAWRNIFRNKKQAILVLVSLFLGVTAFIVINSYLANNNGKRVLETLRVDDMVLTNKTNNISAEQVFDQPLMERLSEVKGVKALHPIYAEKVTVDLTENPMLKEYVKNEFKIAMGISLKAGLKKMADKPEDYYGIISGIDEATFDEMNSEQGLQISKKDFLEGKVCVLPAGYWQIEYLKPLENEEIHYVANNQKKSIKVAAVKNSHELPQFDTYGLYPSMIASEKFVKKLYGSNPYIDNVHIDYQVAYDRKTDQQVKALIKNHKIDDESKVDRYDNMKTSEDQMKAAGFVLSAILALLGLLNYFNTMVSSITSRVKEFALLECIGMTRRQQKKMVVMEGLYYGGLSLLLTSTIGIAIAYGVFKVLNEYEMTFILPWLPILLIYVIALLLCAVVPLMIYPIVTKGSTIEQLQTE